MDQSVCSTFELMRGWGPTVSEMVRDSDIEGKRERPMLRRERTWPWMEGVRWRKGTGSNSKLRKEGTAAEDVAAGPVGWIEVGFSHLWKERGAEGQRVKGVGQESQEKCENRVEQDNSKEKEKDMKDERHQWQDRQAGWWYQLRQSSQVYINHSTECSKFVKAEKKKAKSSESQRRHLPPTREGVVEGAESSQEELRHRSRNSSSSSSLESVGPWGRPSWMGSPPESVVTQENEYHSVRATEATFQTSAQEESSFQGQGLHWGRLFGSSVYSPSKMRRKSKNAEQRTKAPSIRYVVKLLMIKMNKH